jgi:hypothetical protein
LITKLSDGRDDRVPVTGIGVVLDPDQRAHREGVILSPLHQDKRV